MVMPLRLGEQNMACLARIKRFEDVEIAGNGQPVLVSVSAAANDGVRFLRGFFMATLLSLPVWAAAVGAFLLLR